MSIRLRAVVAIAVGTAIVSASAPLATASSTTPAHRGLVAKTTITLKVRGCSDCKVQPAQTDAGLVTYWGTKKKVRHHLVTWSIPTRRTTKMSFLVYAPFDSYAQMGYPMVAVTQFKEKAPGSRVTAAFAGGTHRASGCWSGTAKSSVRNTLVVQHRRVHGETLAAGWLKRTWDSQRYFNRLRQALYHVEDPSICT